MPAGRPTPPTLRPSAIATAVAASPSAHLNVEAPLREGLAVDGDCGKLHGLSSAAAPLLPQLKLAPTELEA